MTATLTAWNIRRYGAPDQMESVQRPMPKPGPTEILIRIHASAVTRADGMMRAGQPKFARLFLGLGRPRHSLVGTGLSGQVIAVGADVTRFAIGDAVFGEAGLQFGANASHICLDEAGVLMPKPDHLSHQDAAVMCDGPLTSFYFLHMLAKLTAGSRVLILGGSGSLGSAAVQIAHAAGADVAATCGPSNIDLVTSLGADHVLDYTAQPLQAAGGGFDVVFDTLGVSSFSDTKAQLGPKGQYLSPVLSLGVLGAMLCSRLTGTRRAGFAAVGLLKPAELRAVLVRVLDLVAQGHLSPVQDRSYPLSALIAAHRHMDSGHKRGNIVMM